MPGRLHDRDRTLLRLRGLSAGGTACLTTLSTLGGDAQPAVPQVTSALMSVGVGLGVVLLLALFELERDAAARTAATAAAAARTAVQDA